LIARCHEVGRDPSEIRWALNRGSDVLESAERFREHVAAYSEIGVRSFLTNLPRGGSNDVIRDIAAHLIPELRNEFAKDGRIRV
jgi:hypothetical protein